MESKTEEERLRSELFVLKKEYRNVEQKLQDVVQKNKKWKEQEERFMTRKAELQAEIARLETRNIKAVRELHDSALEAIRIKTRNAELETLSQKQSEEIRAREARFDEYLHEVSHFTSRFRQRPFDPVTFRESGRRTLTSGSGPGRDTENPRSGERDLPLLGPKMSSSEAFYRSAREVITSSAPKPSPAIKSEYKEEGNDKTPRSKDTTAFSPATRNQSGTNSSISDRLQGEQQFSTSSNQQQSSFSGFNAPQKCAGKRPLLPDGKLTDLAEKRRKQEGAQHSAEGSRKTTDPRLRVRY
jgi:hypothetical protein